ncbi:hypothetical protein PPERSA_06599 [Pseudocohnilembus persalinus]|uniref:Transmembrane protein n=1 Tax=Pseudocohnilembus persalinus TaxID=266149 RepID=A0A0V0QSR9_PSEPJ|nr:hypothetical protein PPERSA_06599 [Pseudocohnilembus persalinus]|eukprot:KRX04965.1 hypothetical protein PPERSA_06599 [Pseudocohnilembus persalinus]
MNQKFQSQEINENYYELEVQYQYKEFKEEKDYLLYKKLISEQKDIEQLNYLQYDIEMYSEEENNLFFSIINYLCKLEFISNSKNKIESFQKDPIEKSNSNNNIQQYEDFLQSLYTIKTKTAKACASDKSKKSLIDSIIDFETIPFMYYYFYDEVKMASWDCLDVQKLNKSYQQCYILNDEENENIYENQKKTDNERPEKFVRFQPSMYIDSDLECLLPYYGITMVCFGVQLFIISFLFEKINNEQIYKMLILRKKKFYVKSIDSFVTFTSMFPKKMTQELIKVELAKTFQIQENQVIFYVQTENDLASHQAHQVKNMEIIGKNININQCQNKNNSQINNNINIKKKQNRYVCIAFMTPHLRMVHSINAGKKILLQGLFRKEIASEIFQDFLNPKYYDFDKNPQYLAHNQENPYNNTIDIENYLQNDRFLINSAKIKINYLRIYKVLNKQIIQNLKQFAEDDEQQQELDGDLLEEENLPWVDQFNFADNMNKMLQYIDKKSSSIESRLLNDDSILYV